MLVPIRAVCRRKCASAKIQKKAKGTKGSVHHMAYAASSIQFDSISYDDDEEETPTPGFPGLVFQGPAPVFQSNAVAHSRKARSLPFGSHAGMMFQSDVALDTDPPKESPVMKLISQQNADGSWLPDDSLHTLLGLKPQQIKKSVPQKDIELSLWATVLAVIWLHAFGADTKDEWELLVDKSLSWIKANAGSDLGGCVKAGNALLKTSVDPCVFGF
ncbi:von Willebrand factor A domain-containing protein 5A-like isoform X2 [Scyliorhinus canicula]|uniref:von Willebrand factor A domain-containing protein 5A-like isoform X2 n=1 Tax=Scyliorhinus canicula TaxID=7830 RepID=UPI0018F53379|nr:von Willebrand factor A domain-containing protein 5A-like isoform X2 [Scyliorhinus canicula]